MATRNLLLASVALLALALPAAAQPLADPFQLPPGALARLGSPRLRHTSSALHLCFAADGQRLASVGNETSGGGACAVRVWEMPSGRELRCIWLDAGRGAANRVALSPDGKLVAWSGYYGGGVTVADIATGKELDRLHPTGPKDPPSPFAFAPDGKTLATGGGGKLCLWDLATGKEKLKADVGDFDQCRFSPDGRALAVVGPKFAGLRLIDVDPKRKTFAKQLPFPVVRPGPHAVAFTPDGEWLAAADDNLVRVWDAATGKPLLNLPWQGQAAIAVAFARDGKTLTAATRAGDVRTWDTATGKVVRTVTLAFAPGAVAFAPDLRWLAACHGKAVRLVDLNTGREPPATHAQPGSHYTTAYAFTPDSRHLVTPGEDDRLLIWEARTGKLVRAGTEDMRSVAWLAVTPDGKQILSMSYDRKWAAKPRLDEWDFATGKRLRQLELDLTPGWVALSPDGKLLACGEPNDSRYRMHKTGDAVLIDRATGKQVRHFDAGAATAPQALAFAPDGKTLATIGRDGAIRLWETATGKLLRGMKAPGHEGLTYLLRFIDGGRAVASMSQVYGAGAHIQTHVIVWDAATGKELGRGTGPKDLGWCKALTPDGKRLIWAGGAWAGRHETVGVWDVAAGRAEHKFEGLRGGPGFLLIAPDGRTVAAGAADDTILIWDITAGRK